MIQGILLLVNYQNEDLGSIIDVTYTSSVMCLARGAALTGFVSDTITVTSLLRCAAMCTHDENCLSANYNSDSKACQINIADATQLAAMLNYNSDLSQSNVYISRVECLDVHPDPDPTAPVSIG